MMFYCCSCEEMESKPCCWCWCVVVVVLLCLNCFF